MTQSLATKLKLRIHAEVGRQYSRFLAVHIRKAHAVFPTQLADLSIALVSDKHMSALHQQFLNIPGPTDVLTFPLEVDSKGRATTGEIVICVPYARGSAQNHGVSVKNELLLYAIHGILHLAGLDDRTAAQYNRMHRIEDDILTQLGVGAVFDRAARGER